MEKIYGFIGVAVFYLIIRYLFFKKKNQGPDPITDVLSSGEYKVKGQWDE